MKQLLDKVKTYCSQFFHLLFILEYEDLHKEPLLKKETSDSPSILNKT
jgi:hypothetical protein